MERLIHNHADDLSELLSAYSDNALDLPDRRRAEAQVQSCPGCAQELRDLRMFQSLLHELPTVQPRRSFTLDPATAVGPRRLLFPTLRLATLAASLLFFVVLGIDLLNLGGVSAPSAADTFSTKQAPAAASTRQLDPGAAGGASVPEAAELPPVAAASADPAAAAVQSSAQDALPATAPMSETTIAAANAPAPTPGASSPDVFSFSQADQAETTAGASAGTEAGGAAAELQSNQTSSPDTADLRPEATTGDDRAALTALRIAEIALGLIALGLASGAVWTWRQQR